VPNTCRIAWPEKPHGLVRSALLAAGLAGCAGLGEPAAPVVAPVSAPAPASIPTERLVGSWGIASFHDEKDRKRTEAEARGQCRQAYVIRKGATDGVMMHVADDPKLYELKLKGGPGGTTFLGFEAPAGDPQDREIVSFSDTIIVMRFVDPDAHRRYGTFVYVRCGR
jgi:hypothetical protein